MTRAILRAAALAALMSGLAGCSAISALGEATTPLEAYELRAPLSGPVARRSVARDLVIEVPGAGGALATERIMIRPNPLQAQYLPGVRWTDTAPVMLQTLMLRSFENANALRYVGRRPLGSFGDVTLLSELTDFQAELGADGQSVSVRVRMTARVLRESDGAVIASRSFQTTAPALSTDPLDVVGAFNMATDSLMGDLTGWALGRIGVALQG